MLLKYFMRQLKKNKYSCFLSENRKLPMMYMDDAINATISIMILPQKIKIRTSYNLSSLSFSPKQIELEIKKHIENLRLNMNLTKEII